MEPKFEITTCVFGPSSNMENEFRVLNRRLRWADFGVTCEPDHRHAEFTSSDFLTCVAATAPTVHSMDEETPIQEKTPRVKGSRSIEDQRQGTDASRYRDLAAHLSYISFDCPDLQFTSKLASLYMATPRVADWAISKRVARYFLGSPRAVQTFRWPRQRQEQLTLTAIGASERTSRTSTSGGVICVGHYMVKHGAQHSRWLHSQTVRQNKNTMGRSAHIRSNLHLLSPRFEPHASLGRPVSMDPG